MSKNSSFYAAFIYVLCCSAAIALQPTVRAGSISLNSGIKPTSGSITSTTTSAATNVSTDTSRGSALTKFATGNVVPVSRPTNNTSTQSSSAVLDELRTAISNLTAAQARLENDQLTLTQVEDTVENTVISLNLTTTNTSPACAQNSPNAHSRQKNKTNVFHTLVRCIILKHDNRK